METITLTLREIFDMRASLDKLFAQDMPARLAFRLSKLVQRVKTELEHVEEIRQRLVVRHGESQEDGTTKVAAGKFDEFIREFETCLAETIDISFDKISISDIDKVSLSPLDLAALSSLVVE